MTQRIYWAPHTLCFLGCHHCHNDSDAKGSPGSPDVVDAVIANLPDVTSRYRLEEVLIGGGEPLMVPDLLERAVRGLRARYPQGPRDLSVDERRKAGYLVVAVQTNGLLLADAEGHLVRDRVERWLSLGVDYYHVASGDVFHQSRRPTYPWDRLFEEMAGMGDVGAYFHVYGKAPAKLVPSGRGLVHQRSLATLGAALLTERGYCATGWETGSNWLRADQDHPDCSELTVDEAGLAHPCCWYRLSPALFDLTRVSFEVGMAEAERVDALRLLDSGDVLRVGALAGIRAEAVSAARDALGDCGACRLFFAHHSALATPGLAGAASPLSAREARYFRGRLRDAGLGSLLADLGLADPTSRPPWAG